MVLLIRMDKTFDIKYRDKVHKGLSKREAVSFLKTAGVLPTEISLIQEDKNCHFFGNMNLFYMFSENRVENYLRESRQ